MSRTKLTQNSIAAGAINANTMFAADVVGPHAIANTSTYSVGELLVGGTILLDNTGNIQINNGGTIGSTGDADAISIATGGVVTMNQIPVLSAGLNVSGGTIAGTLSTAAQTNITSLGTIAAFRSTGIDDNADALAITINSSERVGIGTTAPLIRLDAVEDNIGADVAMGIFQGGNAYGNLASTATLYLGATYHALANAAKISSSHSTGGTSDHAQDIVFSPVNSGSASFDAMRITNTGAVSMGFGVATPTSPVGALHIKESNSSAGATLMIEQASTGDPNIRLATAATSFMIGLDNSDSDFFKIDYGTTGTGAQTGLTMDTSGNIGIGTSSPQSGLHLASGSGWPSLAIHFTSPNTGHTSGAGKKIGSGVISGGTSFDIGGGTNLDALKIYSYPSGVATIGLVQNHLAYVGIGTTSPATTLHVVGGIEIDHGSAASVLTLDWVAAKSGRVLFAEGATTTGAITMHSPTDSENDVLTGNQQDGNMVLGTGSAGAAGEALVLVTNGVERMQIDANGAVTQPLQPAFCAYVSSSKANVTGNAVAYTIVYDGETFDQGADFATSTFTAPVTGKYLLTFRCTTNEVTATHTDGYIRIVTSNRNYDLYFDPADHEGSAAYGIGTIEMTVLADMDASDTAQTLVVINFGVQDVDVHGTSTTEYTTFSGHLVA